MTTADHCPDCTGIVSNPSHYDGARVTPEAVLRCVLYEAFTLMICVQSMSTSWNPNLVYDVPDGTFDPNEPLKQNALLKIRLLYDFLYADSSKDDFQACTNFSKFGVTQQLPPPQLVGFDGKHMFTRKSINKFVAHLTKARITKPKCVVQPKFGPGVESTIDNSVLIATDVLKLSRKVIAHQAFGTLDEWGDSYFDGLNEALQRIGAV